MKDKACKNCHRIVKGNQCPICKESKLTQSWKGYTIIKDPEKSELAKELKVDTPGKYALRIKK